MSWTARANGYTKGECPVGPVGTPSSLTIRTLGLGWLVIAVLRGLCGAWEKWGELPARGRLGKPDAGWPICDCEPSSNFRKPPGLALAQNSSDME